MIIFLRAFFVDSVFIDLRVDAEQMAEFRRLCNIQPQSACQKGLYS